jgi:hypothetical protein
MFDFLDQLDDTTFNRVAYEASLLLYERERHRGLGPRFPALRGSEADLTGEITRLVHRVLAEIEAAQRVPFTELSREAYAGYMRVLDEMSSARVRSMPGYDPERAERLLEELRRDYYPHAA